MLIGHLPAGYLLGRALTKLPSFRTSTAAASLSLFQRASELGWSARAAAGAGACAGGFACT